MKITLEDMAPDTPNETLQFALKLLQAKTVADPTLLSAIKAAMTKWNSTTKRWT